MRCAACGARNPDTAAWCSQCFDTLAVASDAAASAPDEASPSPPAPAPPTSGTDGRQAAGEARIPADDAVARDVRQRDGEVEWRCGVCEGWSSLLADRCERCGAPRTGFGAQTEAPVTDGDTDQLVAWTLLLPGLGHLRAGRAGSGLARAVIAVGWLLGAVLLGIAALGAGRLPVAAAPLLLGALVVWVASVRDVRGLARGERRELLDARGLLWLVAAVTGLLVVSLLLETMRLAG